MRSGACWLVAVGCSIPQGISVAWTAIMVINLTEVSNYDGCLYCTVLYCTVLYCRCASRTAASPSSG